MSTEKERKVADLEKELQRIQSDAASHRQTVDRFDNDIRKKEDDLQDISRDIDKLNTSAQRLTGDISSLHKSLDDAAKKLEESRELEFNKQKEIREAKFGE